VNVFKRAFLLSIFMVLIAGTNCSAATKTNVYLMGDSIIDNYPHEKTGLYETMASSKYYKVRCDYSYEGSKICTDMYAQTKKVIKKLKLYPDQDNVVIYSFGANDILKKCNEDHYYILKKCLKKIRAADPNVKIICINPTHIQWVCNKAGIKTMFEYPLTDKWMKKYVITLNTAKYLSSSDIRTDCLHLKTSGYTKTLTQIKRVLSK